jgi:2-dehydro-3-deoxyglucarate aldolase/4-hydroxy-2-oxoheptanedioate aldolase
MMKINRCKQIMKEGRIPIGHMLLEFDSRGVPRMLEAAGLDYVVIDMEHSGFSTTDVADLLAWFKATQIAPFVRIPEIQYHFVARALDAGAMGIMLPNVESADQARALVEAAKYAPLGRRGVGLGTTNTDFLKVNPREFMDFANENTTLICQIESVKGLDNLEAIASMPGIDILWVGQFDITQSMGIPGQFDHPWFIEAVNQVIATAKKYQKGAAIMPINIGQAEAWLGMGFNVIAYSGDLFVYIDTMTQCVSKLRGFIENLKNPVAGDC